MVVVLGCERLSKPGVIRTAELTKVPNFIYNYFLMKM